MYIAPVSVPKVSFQRFCVNTSRESPLASKREYSGAGRPLPSSACYRAPTSSVSTIIHYLVLFSRDFVYRMPQLKWARSKQLWPSAKPMRALWRAGTETLKLWRTSWQLARCAAALAATTLDGGVSFIRTSFAAMFWNAVRMCT